MSFTVLIPARLASTRLPNKPLADIAGVPMIVRVAQRAQMARALAGNDVRVVVAADHIDIGNACHLHSVEFVLTDVAHPSGSDRLAQACDLLKLSDDTIVVNVQGDEPLIEPALIVAVAKLLAERPEASMSTAAHAIDSPSDFHNPNIVKVVVSAAGLALYFSRAPIPQARDAPNQAWWLEDSATADATSVSVLRHAAPLRHVGIYAYRAGFLRRFPMLAQAPIEVAEALEQLRALWHGYTIAVHITALAPGLGVDTPADLARVREIFSQLPLRARQ